MNQKVMNRNRKLENNQDIFYDAYLKKAIQLDNALIQEVNEDSESFEDERELNNREKLNKRKTRRKDNVSKNIYRAKKWDYK